MEIFQPNPLQLPVLRTRYRNQIIDDGDPTWHGIRLWESYILEPFTVQDIGKPLGLIAEEGPYPFDGNNVRHVNFEGVILPDGIHWLCGKPCLTNGIILIDPTKHQWVESFNESDYDNAIVRMLLVDTFWATLEIRVTWWVYYRNMHRPTSPYTFRVDAHGIAYNAVTGLYSELSSSFQVSISRYDRRNVPMSDWVSYYSSQIVAKANEFFTSCRNRSYSAGSRPSWVTYDFSDSHPPDPTYEYHAFRRIARRYLEKFPWNDMQDVGTGELTRECVQGQHSFDGNLLNWADKLTGWGGGIKAALDVADNMGDPKAWASAWLSNRFGDRLEYNTSLDLLDAVWEKLLTIPIPSKYSGFNVTRASLSTPYGGGQLTRRMRLVCSNDSVSSLMTAVKKFMDWDAWPTLENTFDLIPLSFVVDWFTNLSVILDNVDQMVYKQYLKCELCESSAKLEIPLQIRTDRPGTLYHFEGKVILYSRRGSSIIPEFGILEGWDPRLPSLTNIVDGASLLCQFLT